VTAGREEAVEEERGGLGACVDHRKNPEVELSKIESCEERTIPALAAIFGAV